MSDFDPRPYLRKLKGKGGEAEYLDVKYRLLWLRHEHPNAIIETECLRDTPESAAFKATVTIPNGGCATGHGDETIQDFRDFYTKAETKALGRAIAALGYGTQFVGNELDEGERIVDSPIPVPAQPARRDTANPPPAFGAPKPVAATPNPPAPSAGIAAARSSASSTTPQAADYDDNLGWTEFWSWARKNGYQDRHACAVALGKADGVVNGWTPAQIRTALEVASIERARGTA